MKKVLIILFFLLITNNTHAKGHKYPEEVCKEIYQGIGYFLKEADVLWKKRGSSNDKKALMYTQAAANYTVVYESFCKLNNGKKKRRPNMKNASKVLNKSVDEIKDALGRPPNYKQAAEKLNVTMKELRNALFPKKQK